MGSIGKKIPSERFTCRACLSAKLFPVGQHRAVHLRTTYCTQVSKSRLSVPQHPTSSSWPPSLLLVGDPWCRKPARKKQPHPQGQTPQHSHTPLVVPEQSQLLPRTTSIQAKPSALDMPRGRWQTPGPSKTQSSPGKTKEFQPSPSSSSPNQRGASPAINRTSTDYRVCVWRKPLRAPFSLRFSWQFFPNGRKMTRLSL